MIENRWLGTHRCTILSYEQTSRPRSITEYHQYRRDAGMSLVNLARRVEEQLQGLLVFTLCRRSPVLSPNPPSGTTLPYR